MIILIHPLPINLNFGTTITTNNLQSPTSRTTMTTPPYHDHSSTKKWKSWQSWKDQSKSQYHTHPSGWVDYSKPYCKHQSYDEPPSRYPSKPLTAFSLDQHSHNHGNHPNRSGSAQSRASTLPPGHIAINLQEGSKEEWARQVKHALTHPDRMRAANELDAKELPQPSTGIVQEHFEEAMEELNKVDSRIPTDIGRKAITIFEYWHPDRFWSFRMLCSRTSSKQACWPWSCRYQKWVGFKCPHLLAAKPSSHGHLAMVRLSVPPSWFSWRARSDQQTGPITKNPQRCHMPTFGAFYIGRQIANADKNIPSWAEQELLDSMEKKGKGQQEITIGAIYRGSLEHLSLRAGGNEKCQLNVAKKGNRHHSWEVQRLLIATTWGWNSSRSNGQNLKDDDKLARRPIDLRGQPTLRTMSTIEPTRNGVQPDIDVEHLRQHSQIVYL